MVARTENMYNMQLKQKITYVNLTTAQFNYKSNITLHTRTVWDSWLFEIIGKIDSLTISFRLTSKAKVVDATRGHIDHFSDNSVCPMTLTCEVEPPYVEYLGQKVMHTVHYAAIIFANFSQRPKSN